MEIMTAGQWDLIHGSATLFIEDRDSLDEERCFAELIDYLVEKGADVKRCE